MKLENVADIHALSPLQQGMLFHARMAPKSPAYFEQVTCRIEGMLDVSALEGAWRQAVQQHAALRSAFLWEGLDDPVAVVHGHVDLVWEKMDWRGMSDAEQNERFDKYLCEDRERGIDLTHPPLMRFALIRLSENAHYFAWGFHHILLDGWSVPIVLKNVLAQVESISRGTRVSPSPERPFSDYILWLQKQDRQAAQSFWREYLRGFESPTPLPLTRHASASHDTFAQNTITRSLPFALTSRITSFARDQRVTLSVFVQAAWALLLNCYSGENDVVFGVTLAGRPPELPGVEAMVGLFINTLPQRVKITAEPIGAFLQGIQARQLELECFSYSPLVDAQSASGVARGTALFESIVIFENYPVSDALENASTLKIRDARTHEQTNFPMNLIVLPNASLTLCLCYDIERFDHHAAEKILERLAIILERLCENAAPHVMALPWLGESETRRVVSDWNQTARSFSARCFHELFETRAKEYPDAVAISFDDGALTYTGLTYAELNARASKLAHYLRQNGATRGNIVAICLERSVETIVSILATMKAGCAYLPLDPAYPRERIEFMLADAKPAVLLTSRAGVSTFSNASAKTKALCLDVGWDTNLCGTDNLSDGTGPTDLAYVIYTSGSTGVPKGVMLAHEGLCNLAQYQARAFECGPGSRVLQFSSLSFDASVWEIAMALGSGAELCLATRESIRPGTDLFRTLEARRITHATLPPPALAVLPRKALPELQVIVVAGEACPGDLLEFWAANRRFFNAYGPTESTVCASFFECQAGSVAPPIGTPVPNAQLYVLDAHMRPVPVGVAGELFIGGILLAQGYLNRHDLTAEKFIPDPFSGTQGARLYRTGDHVRRREDGNLEFIGRIDQQVKLRGFRIELGEVEAALSACPDVQATAALIREDRAGDKRLTAYVQKAPAATLDSESLRAFLREKLPEHFMPAAFVIMDHLPLTQNGKVDKKALARTALSVPAESARPLALPTTDIEQKIAAVWCEVLGIEQRNIHIHDSFFDLGGHSLSLARANAMLNDVFGREIPMADMFRAPTIHALARYLSGESDEPAAREGADRADLRKTRRAEMQKRGGVRQRHRRGAKTEEVRE